MSDEGIRFEVRTRGAGTGPRVETLVASGTRSNDAVALPSSHAIFFEGATWHGVRVTGQPAFFTALHSRFEECSFDSVILRGTLSAREQVVYRDCTFKNADLRDCQPGHARFERCTFDQTDIDGWVTDNAEFIGCTFRGVIRNVVFMGRSDPTPMQRPLVPRTVNQFEGNDFTGADLRGVAFRKGIDVSKQVLPDDPKLVVIPDIHRAVARARAGVQRWSPSAERDLTLRWLESKLIGLDPGASLLYVRGRTPLSPDIESLVLDLLIG